MNEYGSIQAPPLAADLDYMLQNQQVEDRLVAEELLKGYFGAVRALVEQVLGESPLGRGGFIKRLGRLRIGELSAWIRFMEAGDGTRKKSRAQNTEQVQAKHQALVIDRAVEAVFVRAVANRSTYQPGEKVGVWLFRQTQAALGLKQNRRLGDLEINEFSEAEASGGGQAERDWKELAEKLAPLAQRRRRHAWSPKRVIQASFTILMVFAAAWLFLLINPPYAKPVATKVPSPTLALSITTASGIEKTADAGRILVPERAPYDTVQMDVRVHFPEWQSMAPPWYRLQAWIGKDQLLALGGPEGNAPVEGILIKDGLFYRSRLEEGGLHFEQVSGLGGYPIYRFIFDTLDLLFNGEQGSDLTDVHGQGEMAGRLAWSVRLTNKDTGRQVQIWLDEQTGFTMGYQLLTGSSSTQSIGTPDLVQVVDAAFNVSFPQALFDPDQVRDSWGN